MIQTSAPGKLMLFGDHAVVYGYPCIVAAINKRISVVIEKTEHNEITILTPGNDNHAFVQKTLSYCSDLWNIPKNIVITITSEFTGKYGFGSSSAVVVALVRALAEMVDVSISPRELFDGALRIVLDVQQGVGSGFDVAAACFGGTIVYQNKGAVIDEISLPSCCWVVGYTGVKANTVAMVQKVSELRAKEPATVDRICRLIGEDVLRARECMRVGDCKSLGEIMDSHHRYLQELGVSSDRLDTLVRAAKQGGALGAKLSGAGGGDCMIALVSEDSKISVEKAIQDAGGEVVSVSFHEQGVRRDL
ncbi:MAG: mevalonate kinase [Patescibacteria group bacterium]|nr:mevalonate kinase [Patescibacteria group bacterium]